MSTVEQVAEAVLYEGYLLFPYRPTARKNQQRWTFGGVYPRGTSEPSEMQTQVLLRTAGDVTVDVAVRFLQVVDVDGREEAIERRFDLTLPLGASRSLPIDAQVGAGVQPLHESSPTAAREAIGAELHGEIAASCQRIEDSSLDAQNDTPVWRVNVSIRNTAIWGSDRREQALKRTFVSTHTILRCAAGEFVSLLEPPEDLRKHAEECRNVGTWPVLVDDSHTMLSSPIILYDYAEVSPQSPGALFDTTEIDELLTLSVLALPEQEKAEIRLADARGRELLERTESLTPEQILELHGVMRELR